MVLPNWKPNMLKMLDFSNPAKTWISILTWDALTRDTGSFIVRLENILSFLWIETFLVKFKDEDEQEERKACFQRFSSRQPSVYFFCSSHSFLPSFFPCLAFFRVCSLLCSADSLIIRLLENISPTLSPPHCFLSLLLHLITPTRPIFLVSIPIKKR